MSVKTNNIYGRISITDYAICRFISEANQDYYGIVKFVPKGIWKSIVNIIKFGSNMKGISIHTSGDRITIGVSVIVKYGISIKAVVEALKESMKYKVERFTGMVVDAINVSVVGVSQ